MPQLTSRYRSHTCAELRKTHVGESVRLAGWIMRMRDHGGVVFVDLRDHYGITQLVFHEDALEQIQKLRVESVIEVVGKVLAREQTLINPNLATGEIEVHSSEFTLHSPAKVLPFLVAEDDGAPEAERLRYRFLELRRETLHKHIVLRSDVIDAVRQEMKAQGFREYQTPILTSSSPEGARDFIVPSRLHPGKFYALPQAPQQFKQLLMVAGFDRYFQIAPCFRDEDARADRSAGEFYQLDLEMSFVEQEEVLQVNEKVISNIFNAFSQSEITPAPFPRIPYREAMRRYGSDKPDLRNSLTIEDVGTVLEKTGFRVFREVLDGGGGVFCIKVDVPSLPPRKYFDDAIDWFKSFSGQGLAYLSYEENGECKGSIRKFFTDEEIEALKKRLNISGVCSLFFGAGPEKQLLPFMGKLRNKLGQDFDKIEKNAYRFLWVTDFPFYDRDEKTGELIFFHNPFSMPRGGLHALNTQNPDEIEANQYDLVCNGYELGSGAIRNHLPEVMEKAFELVGYGKEVLDQKFGGMIKAFQFGAPPHGGFAHGIDRIVMLLAGQEAVREVIAFPLSQAGEDLLMDAPSELDAKQLKEVHIRLDVQEKVSVQVG